MLESRTLIRICQFIIYPCCRLAMCMFGLLLRRQIFYRIPLRQRYQKYVCNGRPNIAYNVVGFPQGL